MEALHLKEDDIYCEIGCGGGALLNMAMEKAKRGAAIDHSKEMVELSNENNRKYIEAGRLEVLKGDAEKLPWESGVFTACVSANMFFFVNNLQTVLSEIFRVMKPGGRFSMVTPGQGFIVKMTFGWLYSLKIYSDRGTFNENNRIICYDNEKVTTMDFPYKKLIEKFYYKVVFSKVINQYLKSRDQ